VPADVATCYCGQSRALAEAQTRRDQRNSDSGLRSLVVPAGLGVIAVLLYLAWPRPVEAPAPAPPVAGPGRAEPDARSREVAAGPGRTADASPQTTPAPADAFWEMPTPAPLPAPVATPAPTPSATPEASEVDRRREAGEKRLEETLAKLKAEMDLLSRNAREFEAVCLSVRSDPGSCQGLFRSVAAGGEALRRGVEDAEEDARRSWVSPGVVRDLRRKHGLEEQACADIAETVRRLVVRYQGGS